MGGLSASRVAAVGAGEVKGISLYLAGEQPTPEERAKFDQRAEEHFGTQYRERRTETFDPVRKRRVIRLDAIEKK